LYIVGSISCDKFFYFFLFFFNFFNLFIMLMVLSFFVYFLAVKFNIGGIREAIEATRFNDNEYIILCLGIIFLLVRISIICLDSGVFIGTGIIGLDSGEFVTDYSVCMNSGLGGLGGSGGSGDSNGPGGLGGNGGPGGSGGNGLHEASAGGSGSHTNEKRRLSALEFLNEDGSRKIRGLRPISNVVENPDGSLTLPEANS
jgi:hypothetical protein